MRKIHKIATGSLTLATVALALAAAFIQPADAQGVYAGASIGQPDWKDGVNGIDGSATGPGLKAYGGYSFNDHFALEAGAASLGHADHDDGDAHGQGLYLDGVGRLPVAQGWSLLGSVGLADARIKTSSATGVDSDSGTGYKLGASVEYQLSPTTALRGEWESWHVGVFDEHPHIDEYSVGLRVLF